MFRYKIHPLSNKICKLKKKLIVEIKRLQVEIEMLCVEIHNAPFEKNDDRQIKFMVQGEKISYSKKNRLLSSYSGQTTRKLTFFSRQSAIFASFVRAQCSFASVSSR